MNTNQPKPATGEWTLERVSKIMAEEGYHGIVAHHNAALAAAWRKGHADAQAPALERIDKLHQQLAAEREKVDNATDNCMSLSKLLYAEREKVRVLEEAMNCVHLIQSTGIRAEDNPGFHRHE